MIIRSMIGHVRGMLSTYRSDAITPIVLQPDMVYANLWALRHSYLFCSVSIPPHGLHPDLSSLLNSPRTILSIPHRYPPCHLPFHFFTLLYSLADMAPSPTSILDL